MLSFRGLSGVLAASIVIVGTPASAAVRTVFDHLEPLSENRAVRLALTILNPSDVPVDHELPESIPVQLKLGSTRYSLIAFREAASPSMARIGAKGFGEAHYRLDLPRNYTASASASLSLGEGETEIALVLPHREESEGPRMAAQDSAPTSETPAFVETAAGRTLFSNFSVHEPMYVVYGNTSSNDTRLQISFKYQLFGDSGAPADQRRWIDNFYLAYTQRTFIDFRLTSNPVPAIDFQPELFYQFRPRSIGSGLDLGGQLGFRHVSNGKGGGDSRSYNLLFVRPDLHFAMAGQQVTLSPSAWAYIGKDVNNPDIGHYRGYSGLSVAVGTKEGLMLTADSRFSFGSGKGAVDATASYPLSRLFGARFNLYLFAQAFTGYGESLVDYQKRATRLRVGLGFVR